jgi:hypothetical protein
MKKISIALLLCLAVLDTKAQSGGFLDVSDNFRIEFKPSAGTGTPNIASFWRIPNPANPPIPKYQQLCNVFFTLPTQTPPGSSYLFTPQSANLFQDLLQITDQSNTAVISMGVMNGSGILAVEPYGGYTPIGNEALKLNPGCPMNVNICEGGGLTRIFNGAEVLGGLSLSPWLRMGGGTFNMQSAIEANLNPGQAQAISIVNPSSGSTNKRIFEVSSNGKTSIGVNLQTLPSMLSIGQSIKTDLAICMTDNTTTTNKHFFYVYGSGQTFIGTDLQQTTSMFTVGQASKTNLALSLTDNTTATNKAFYNVYGSGQTFVGPDLQQNTNAMFTVGQASKTNLALSLTDNTTATNKAFYNVYGSGQTYIGPDLQQNNGSMLTVGQANDNALALSLTDNGFNPAKDFFNVYGNGYTEIKVHSPAGMPNDRVLAIKDMANSKDLFVVKKDGKVYAREVEISTIPVFPDYVFDKSYKLKTIPEVARFINDHKHLPGFEKGEYYEKNGVNVGDLMLKQQEKLEEQMLYIIQLEKRLQALENKK